MPDALLEVIAPPFLGYLAATHQTPKTGCFSVVWTSSQDFSVSEPTDWRAFRAVAILPALARLGGSHGV